MPTTQTVVVDSDNEFDWNQITTSFNDNGVLTNRLTDFDNGNTMQEYFDGVTGAPSVTIEKDIADVENWVQIFTSYDSFGTATQTTSFDSGVTREDRIVPALSEESPAYLSSRREYDDGDAFNWASRGSSYDFFGNLTQSYVRYDNGVYDARSFQNGVMTSRVKRDTDDIASWDEIETTYDQGGQIAERLTQFDNGVFKHDVFQDGVRSSTYQADNLDTSTGAFAADGGAKSWQEIETTYDQGGQISERMTQFDDGIFKHEVFEDGVRSSTYQADGLDTATGAFAADGGAKTWQEIETTYDQGGQITFKNIVYDNGSTSQTVYEDGARSIMLKEDVEDAFVWKAVVTEYDDAGKVAFKGTEFDNGDQMVAFFVEQELQTRIEVDGDGSEVWGARLTDYQSGQAVVTTYDSVNELPEPYAGLLGDVATY